MTSVIWPSRHGWHRLLIAKQRGKKRLVYDGSLSSVDKHLPPLFFYPEGPGGVGKALLSISTRGVINFTCLSVSL